MPYFQRLVVRIVDANGTEGVSGLRYGGGRMSGPP